jgi:predicted metal-dependent peptidase
MATKTVPISSTTLDEQLRAERASGGLVRLKLTSEEEKLWTETRSAMLVSCPMFSHLLYTMLQPKGQGEREHIAFFTDKVPIAATDSYEVYINPGPFFKLTLSERVFVLAHEIMHAVFNHCGLMHMFKSRGKVTTVSGKSYDYIHDLMNMAMDYVINDLLHESKVGTIIKGICHDKNIGTKDESCIDVYEKLWKKCGGPKSGNISDMPGYGHGLGKDVLSPGAGQGKDPATAAGERNEQQWQTEVAAAVASAKAQGKLPAALEQAFGEILDPVVDWTEYVKAFFARKVGAGGYDWRRPERQLITRGIGYVTGDAIYAPGRSGYGAGTIVVGMDSSGSIYSDPTCIDRWFAELGGILNDLRPKRIIVVWCDAAVQRVDEVEESADLDLVRHKGAKGGGGTSFVPVFDYIEQEGLSPVDALVYLTDGMGTFPSHAPEYPVLWGNITPNYDKNYPFGEVVTIPLQK